VLSFVCLPTLAWADFKAGIDAYHRGDYTTALREWLRLAEQWEVEEAQFNVGLLYENGRGVPQDYVQARQWYTKAAAQGYAVAQCNLGRLYEFGHGVPQDYVQAYMWYILGAAHGEKVGAELRDALAKRMTLAQIFQAQERAREWKPKKP
jgi:TPR repeat protein